MMITFKTLMMGMKSYQREQLLGHCISGQLLSKTKAPKYTIFLGVEVSALHIMTLSACIHMCINYKLS
jgi:hypothetical protein